MRVHVGAGDANIRKAPRFRCNRAAERGPDMSYELPPPGWYAAPHANNEQRYWDGAQWLEPTLEVAGDHSATALYPITAPTETPSEGGSKKSHKGWIIGGSVAAGVLVIGGIGGAIGLGSSEPEVEPWTTATPWSAPDDAGTVEDTEPSEDPVVMVIVPDVVGMTVEDALKELFGKGMGTPDISSFEDPLATVLSTDPIAGEKVEHGTEATLIVEEKPKLTLGQENAISKAQSYLSMMGFSHSGLIEQLEFEGFSTEEATFGADNAGADWNAECAEKAQSYIDMMSFSRQGLYEQLAFEGFTPEQIDFGLAAVGY